MLRQYAPAFVEASYLSAANILVKPVWFLFITFGCARALGADGYGGMMTAISLCYLVFAFGSWGIDRFVVREASVETDQRPVIFSSFLLLRFAAIAMAAVASVLVAWALGYDRQLMVAVAAASGYVFAVSVLEHQRKYLQVIGAFRTHAAVDVGEKITVVVLGSIALVVWRSAATTVGAMAAGVLIVVLIGFHVLRRRGLAFSPRQVSAALVISSLPKLIPFALVSLFGMAYFRVDTVMVEALMDVRAAGLYALPFRIVEAYHMLPVLVGFSVLYPRLSAMYAADDIGGAGRLAVAGGSALVVSGLAVATATTLYSDPLVRFLGGGADFTEAAAVLKILVWTYPVASLTTILMVIHYARSKEVRMSVILGGVTAVNVALNFWAIPIFGIAGAAGTTIVSEVLLCAGLGLSTFGDMRARKPAPLSS